MKQHNTSGQERLYLDPHNGYQECYAVVPQEHWIEVPVDAVKARFYPNDPDGVEFENNKNQWWHNDDKTWVDYMDFESANKHSRVVWSIAKHPEELPFIDDGFLMKVDNVNHPNHYASSAIECIDAMEAMLTHEQFIGYLRGNIFKYQWRYEKKNGLEDLRKSKWYLDRLMEKLNEKEA